jgi:hypothetical protein
MKNLIVFDECRGCTAKDTTTSSVSSSSYCSTCTRTRLVASSSYTTFIVVGVLLVVRTVVEYYSTSGIYYKSYLLLTLCSDSTNTRNKCSSNPTSSFSSFPHNITILMDMILVRGDARIATEEK